MEVVFDFSSNIFSGTVETQDEVAQYISAITPNNFLSFLDFLKDSGYVINEDFVNEVDYSVTEY